MITELKFEESKVYTDYAIVSGTGPVFGVVTGGNVTFGTVLDVAVQKIAQLFSTVAKFSDEIAIAVKVIISLKLANTFIKISRALVPVVASMRALVSLSGVGLVAVGASVAAATATFFALGKAIDDVEEKINKNFQASRKAYDPTTLIGQINAQKENTKEVRKQINIFESHHKLVKAVENAEKQRTDRLIGANRNIFDEQQKLIFKTKDELSTRQKIHKTIQDQNKQFSTSNELSDLINKSVSGVSRGFAEALVLGKKLNMSMKELAQSLLVEIIAKTIERITLLGIEKILSETLFKKDQERENEIRKQNTQLKRQIALQATLNALGGGGGSFLSGLFRASGGSVQKGQPTIVGEQGAEMFIPNSTGQITQAARGVGGGAVNVNFNINTVDASGFEDLLVRSRGTITQLINNAVNEKGRSSII